MTDFEPYANESDVLTLGNLSIENRVDRLRVHGDADITRDRRGLAIAQRLKAVLDATVRALEADGALPDEVRTTPPRQVANPFAPDAGDG